VPKPLVNDIERLNSLRNSMAHSFFPENRRTANLSWKSHDMFSVVGATAMQSDMQTIFDHFYAEVPHAHRLT